MKSTSWLHSDTLADFFVRELARTRNGCSEARLKSVLGETFFFRSIADDLIEDLIRENVVRAEDLSQTERFELLALEGSSDGEWALVLGPDGWAEMHTSLYAALSEAPEGARARQELLAQMERAFAQYELDSPASSFAEQALDLLWTNGLVRGQRPALIGDPRPVLYLRLDAEWRARQADWHARAVDTARTAFEPNPYSPHLVAFLDALPTPAEIDALPWVVRYWHLPVFDTGAVALDVTDWLTRGDVDDVVTAIQRSCVAANLPLRLFVRAEANPATWQDLTKKIRAWTEDTNSTVVCSLAGDDWSPAMLEEASGAELVFETRAAALKSFQEAVSPHVLAQCFRSLLTTLECTAGDTVTASVDERSAGCPVCARAPARRISVDDLAQARSVLRARALAPFSGYVPRTRNDRPFGRRSCV